jgi:hypothetical protein
MARCLRSKLAATGSYNSGSAAVIGRSYAFRSTREQPETRKTWPALPSTASDHMQIARQELNLLHNNCVSIKHDT